MGEWKECTIGDLGKIITGKTPRTAITDNYGGDIPFLSPSDNMDVKYVEFTNKTLTNKGVKEVKNCLLPEDSVCVSCIGSDLGKVLITTQPTVTNQQINSIIVNEDNNVDFVYYLMTVVGKRLNIISKTSTAVPIINKSSFSNYKITVPNFKTQKKIAEILSVLDAKIETNRRINARLEELAQAIFKSWFIDFEPFGGNIPEDWGTGLLADVLDLIKNPIKSSDVDAKPYVPIDTIPMHRLGIEDFDKSENAQSSLIEFCKNDILIGAMRVYFHRVVIAPFDGVTRTTCFVLRPKEEIMLPYLLLLCNQDSTIEFADITSKGTTMPYAIWVNGLGNMKITIPSKEVITNFHNIMMPLLEKIRDGYKELKNLRELRDALLPKLMSGELIPE